LLSRPSAWRRCANTALTSASCDWNDTLVHRTIAAIGCVFFSARHLKWRAPFRRRSPGDHTDLGSAVSPPGYERHHIRSVAFEDRVDVSGVEHPLNPLVDSCLVRGVDPARVAA
ncbi:MAG: hypothetical protein KDB15_15555, partial [Microthrixaceae bacterium]|nr:hypothetical protein [Microthrixaceae bacterium]